MKKGLNAGLALAFVVSAITLASVRIAGQGSGAPLPPLTKAPVRVLLITKGHSFDRQGLMELFDRLGREVVWTHVQHPAAQVFYNQKNAANFDVLAFYDAPGRVKRPTMGKDGKPTFDEVPPASKVDFAQMLMAGKGLVFMHHAISAWTHNWPEYQEVVGGACDWSNEIVLRKEPFPESGAFGGQKQHITVVDKTHPVVEGLGDGFDIVDEAYACPYNEKDVHPLLRTDYVPQEPARFLGKRPHSNLTAWVKTAENSPVVWIQHGHNASAWTNPSFQKLLFNAIQWAGSAEARAWAKKNPTKIFRNVKPLRTATN
ncbi:MAG TPA: ThuA domain-containing protein [Vicinamibacterales bacterium]|nr:ThuA domain-containing protein [Vicinamibacterales bacterium]